MRIDEATELERVDQMMRLLTERYSWFKDVRSDKQFDAALKVISQDRVRLQKLRFGYDFLIHVIPWIIALVAILRK